MTPLVLFDSLNLSKASNEDFYTTTEIIAEQTGNSYKVVSNRVRQYRAKLETIAPLTWHFESSASNHGRAKRKVYHLNKQQALSFVPLLENTEQVVNFTFALAEAFVNMEKELQARKIARAVEKPKGVTLHQAISEWVHYPRHGNTWHTIIRSLLATTVTGLTKKQIQARDTDWRKEKTLLDLLDSEEMERYKMLESIAIAMIEAGSDYEPIKIAIKATMTTKKAVTDPHQNDF